MKPIVYMVLALALTLVGMTVAHAQVQPTASPAAQASPAPTPGPDAAAKVQSAVDKIPVSIPAWVLGIIAFLSELALRFYPTAKPKSWLLLIGGIFAAVGTGFAKLSGLLDLVAQNTKDPSS